MFSCNRPVARFATGLQEWNIILHHVYTINGKSNEIQVFSSISLFVASAFGAARAQNVKGVVYGADTDEPLIGASVYWAGTTVGTGADAEGNYTIHRVKGYDMLVAGFVGYTSDTIRVESGVERVDFRLSNDGVELEEVVVNSTLGGNYVKRDAFSKGR